MVEEEQGEREKGGRPWSGDAPAQGAVTRLQRCITALHESNEARPFASPVVDTGPLPRLGAVIRDLGARRQTARGGWVESGA